MPTTFCPAALTTSPAPSPAKQTSDDQRLRTIGPFQTSVPPIPVQARASDQASPTHHAARPTSGHHSGSPAGTTKSTQSKELASTRTAPPPLRRRTMSTPRSRRHLGRRMPKLECYRARLPGRPAGGRARRGPFPQCRQAGRQTAHAAPGQSRSGVRPSRASS